MNLKIKIEWILLHSFLHYHLDDLHEILNNLDHYLFQSLYKFFTDNIKFTDNINTIYLLYLFITYFILHVKYILYQNFVKKND